jgi:hypothetical protein
MAALEVVLALGVSFPLAVSIYWLFERGVEHFYFALGNSVGWPYM